jgi:Protein of unknown function (DUF2934)
MPSKRNTIPAAQELAGPRRRSEPAPEAPAVRASPETRPSRGAAVHRAPRKTEMHRVSLAPRPPPGREEIARRAYEIWLQTGCVAGRETENWLQAERELWTGCGSAQQS